MRPALWQWILLPGVTMSLGWGLRGYIGGGALGAMIPGAMVAMALCLLLRRDGTDVAAAALFGAIGVAFGGQMTYGQTIGLSLEPATAAWGLLGLGIKGAVWGLLGGALVGAGLVLDSLRRKALFSSLALTGLGTYAGWKLINEPKLIYFSNLYDRPRPEIWAGLLLGAIGLLAVISRGSGNRVPLRFGLTACLGGGLGFFLGGAINALGRNFCPTPFMDWWKVMEFTFGFLFGASLGWAAWSCRDALARPSLRPTLTRHLPTDLLLISAALITLSGQLRGRFAFTACGLAVLALGSRASFGAWHIAITMTAAAFFHDFNRNSPWAWSPAVWTVVIISTIAVAFFVERLKWVRPLFLLLTAIAVLDSIAKSAVRPLSTAHILVEVTFVAMAVAVYYLLIRLPQDPTRPHLTS